MPEKRWKAQERRIARLLGARRNPSGDPHAPDVENETLSVEVKDRDKLPEWILKALLQSKSKAKPEQLPIVVLSSRVAEVDLVIMDLRQYREWYVGIPKRPRR